MVTVIDPRHPLFGETFPLIRIEDREDHGKCCLIERGWGHNSYVPLNATDRSESPLVSSSIPLSVKSIRQLVSTFKRLTEDHDDVSTNEVSPQDKPHSTHESLDAPDTNSKTAVTPDSDADLPQTRSETERKGESR